MIQKYIISLPPITKKNSQQILTNHRTGKPFIAPSRQYKKYEQAAMWYLTPKPKAVDEYAEEKIKDIQSRAYEAVMKERDDIATRATYLCLLACYQAGLSRRTLVKIQNYMTGPVADKYNEYRNDQLADLWAQVTLQGIGIDAKKTEEPL